MFLFASDEGVDIVMDCVGASYWEKNFRSIKTDGRWILYGLMGGNKIEGDFLAQVLKKRVRIEGSSLRTRSDEVGNCYVSHDNSLTLIDL